MGITCSGREIVDVLLALSLFFSFFPLLDNRLTIQPNPPWCVRNKIAFGTEEKNSLCAKISSLKKGFLLPRFYVPFLPLAAAFAFLWYCSLIKASGSVRRSPDIRLQDAVVVNFFAEVKTARRRNSSLTNARNKTIRKSQFSRFLSADS